MWVSGQGGRTQMGRYSLCGLLQGSSMSCGRRTCSLVHTIGRMICSVLTCENEGSKEITMIDIYECVMSEIVFEVTRIVYRLN